MLSRSSMQLRSLSAAMTAAQPGLSTTPWKPHDTADQNHTTHHIGSVSRCGWRSVRWRQHWKNRLLRLRRKWPAQHVGKAHQHGSPETLVLRRGGGGSRKQYVGRPIYPRTTPG